MSVGLIAALPVEARHATGRNLPVHTPVQINNRLRIIVSGMGAQAADNAVHQLLQSGVQGLVSWGTAAALDKNLHTGDLVLPASIISSGGETFQTDHDWRERIQTRIQAGKLTIHNGTLAETQAILSSPAGKSALHDETGALCADMESAAILRIAAENAVPAVVIRSISDSHDTALPAELIRLLDEFGRPAMSQLMKTVLMNPLLLPHLLRLGQGMHSASKTLIAVRDALDDDMHFPGHTEDLSYS